MNELKRHKFCSFSVGLNPPPPKNVQIKKWQTLNLTQPIHEDDYKYVTILKVKEIFFFFPPFCCVWTNWKDIKDIGTYVDVRFQQPVLFIYFFSEKLHYSLIFSAIGITSVAGNIDFNFIYP